MDLVRRATERCMPTNRRRRVVGVAVLTYLQRDWSPEQVAGRLARAAGGPVISHETSYRFIYAQAVPTNDYRWWHYLGAWQGAVATSSA